MAWVLWGTQGCHLCEQAQTLLALLPSTLIWRSGEIIDSPQALHRYRVRIPVLMHEGSGRELDWPFDMTQLQEFIESCCAN